MKIRSFIKKWIVILTVAVATAGILCGFIIFIILKISTSEISSGFEYPYNDMDFLEINNFTKCENDIILEQKVELAVISSAVSSCRVPDELSDFISLDDYQKLSGAVTITDSDYNYNNYHCCYIESKCYKNNAVINFETSLEKNYFCDFDEHTYYNKVYLKKNETGMWFVYEVFIAPIG